MGFRKMALDHLHEINFGPNCSQPSVEPETAPLEPLEVPVEPRAAPVESVVAPVDKGSGPSQAPERPCLFS